MKKFRNGQRVTVQLVGGEYSDPTEIAQTKGTVVRLRRKDDGAWIELDHRIEQPGVHPFPKGDQRERHVLSFPEFCSPVIS